MKIAAGICPVGNHPFEYQVKQGTRRVYCSDEHQWSAAAQRQATSKDQLAERRCARCKTVKSRDEFAGPTAPYCRPCTASYAREQRAANPDPLRARRDTLSRYGLTPDTFAALLASQGARCAICLTSKPGGQGWHVDHDHTCHARKQACDKCRRGILCDRCNIAIGNLRDDPVIIAAALDYVTAHRARIATS